MVKVERSKIIDQLKGLMIFLVVFGHSIQYNVFEKKDMFWSNPVWKLIYTFHMPLFMAISGWLLFFSLKKLKTSTSKIKFGIKRSISLMLPVVIWMTLYTLVNFVINRDININQLFSNITNGLWFIWALWGGLLILTIGSIFNKQLAISILGFLIILPFHNHGNVALFLYVFPFFVIGYYFNSYQAHIYMKKYIKIIIPVFILVSTALLILWDKSTYIYVSRFSPTNSINISIRYILGFTNSILFLYAFLYIIKFLPKKTQDYLDMIGSKTLSIYIISSFIIYLVQYPIFFDYIGYIYPLILSLIYIKLSVLINNTITKSDKLSYLLLGKQLK
ncbi:MULTISPECIES: acyltransferase family protein [unclassified Aliivibrio]|uniref:acyltransferase family protein n=1 Tax=unclassified Aliivibrio TaxID=2645654 RepID=UPI00159F1125|nr:MULTISPECIES: acyltransferase family protein [unclassified Aliivibrio]